MKFTPFSALALALLAGPCTASLVEEESEALTSWGGGTAQPIQEWVSRRMAGRAHLRELSGEDVWRIEEAASSLPAPAKGLKTSVIRKVVPTEKPLQGRFAPRTQTTDRLHVAQPESKEDHDKPKRVMPVPDVNVAAKRDPHIKELDDELSHWRNTVPAPGDTSFRRMQEERATETTTDMNVTAKKDPHIRKLADKLSHWRNMQKKMATATSTDVNVAAKNDPHIKELADKLAQWRKMQKESASAKNATVTVKVVDVKVKEAQPPMPADQPKQEKVEKMEKVEDVTKAIVTEVKVTDVKVTDVKSPTPFEQAAMPKLEKVEKAKVTESVVTDVKAKEAELPMQAEKPSLPKQAEIEKPQVTESKALDGKAKEEQPLAQAEQATPPKAKKVWNAKAMGTKAKGVEVEVAQPPKHVELRNQPKVEAQAVDTQVVGAHVSAATTTRSVLLCVCGGEFGQGDRIQYTGHAFPTGRTVGTVLAGTKNGYLNIEWDNFHEGHTGNCQLSSCGGCEKSAVNSRWFTACSDVKMQEESQTVEQSPKMKLADLVFGAH